MNQELGEMHWKDGWLFKRLEDGSVRIRKVAPNGSNMPDRIAVIPANEWVSLIQHLSHEQTAESFQAAKAFHEGAAVGRLPALPEPYKVAYEQEKSWREDCERARRADAELLTNHCLTFAEVAGFIQSWTLATPESYAQRTPREVALYQLWVTLKQRIERAADELIALRSIGRLPALDYLAFARLIVDEIPGLLGMQPDPWPNDREKEQPDCLVHTLAAALPELMVLAGLSADPAPRQVLEEKDVVSRVETSATTPSAGSTAKISNGDR